MKNLIQYAIHMAKLFTYVFLVQCLSMDLLVAKEMAAPMNDIEKAMTSKNSIALERSTTRIMKLSGKPLLEIAEFPITGVVTDESGESLPGATVIVEGSTTGTVTDVNGNFSLEVKEGDVLVISFVGFETQKITVGTATSLSIRMIMDSRSLDEVVVVGYGEQRKVTFTGSVSSVGGEDIRTAPVTNVSNSLVGRLPGLSSVTRSGEPGNDDSTIRIRGTNTLGNNGALVVVDGIPGRSLARIDPNSVESITVLKDASAAIYGAQAANGVILVTTKRGKTGKAVIEINSNFGWNQPTVLPEMANAEQYLTMLNEIDMYRNRPMRFTEQEITDFREGTDPWMHPDTDWFGEVLRPWAPQSYHTITASGGNEDINYFVMFGAKGQDGYYYNSATRYDQYDFRTNLDGKINDYIKIGFDVAGRQEVRNFPTRSAGNIFRMIMRGKPNMHAFWPDGRPGPDIEYGDNPSVITTDATGYDRTNLYNLQSTLRLNIDAPWVEGLSFNGNVGLDQTFNMQKRFETPWFLYSWDGNTMGPDGTPELVRGQRGFNDPRLTENVGADRQLLINGMLNYSRIFRDYHAMKVMVGMESRTGYGNTLNAFRRFFVSTAVDQMFAGGNAERDNGGSAYQNARFNYFGRVNYEFQEKYLAEFVWRYDGSYIFPKGSRFGFFPGISVGWRVSEEDFWKNSMPNADHFKIRASYGQTGNDRIDEWQYLASYGFNNIPYIFGIDQENQALRELRIPNSNVTWEVADQYNFGIELGFFNSRLTMEADVFYNYRSQILWWRNASIPVSTGLTLPRENIGEVSNRGYEFITTYNGNAGDFTYQISANAGYALNRVEFWDESPGAPEYQQTTGRPIPTNPFNPNQDLYYESAGIFRNQEQIDATPHWPGAMPGDIIFEDVNGDGVIDGNDRVRNERNNIPRFTGGLNMSAQWKGFDLSVLFQGATGAVRYVNTESGEIGNFLKDFADNRWTPDNIDANYPRTFNRSDEYWMNQRNTFWLNSTDYVRLKNLELGYNFPSFIADKLALQNFRIYVSGFNLLTYSPDLRNFDPESDSASGQSYPLQRVINTGLTLTF